MLENEPFEHRLHAGDDRVDVQNLRLQDLFPAEREKLTSEARCSLTGFLDLEEILARRAVGGQLVQYQFAEPENRREHIVEVVCDATGKLAKRLQLMRLTQLLFELRALSATGHLPELPFDRGREA